MLISGQEKLLMNCVSSRHGLNNFFQLSRLPELLQCFCRYAYASQLAQQDVKAGLLRLLVV